MADEELELDVAPPKSNKKLIIIIVAVVLLNVIAVGAWLFLSGGGDDSSVAEEKKENPSGPLTYLTLVPEFVVNFGPGSKVRYLQVDIQISSRDPAALEIVNTYKPVIRNDILILLSSVSFDVLNKREGKEVLQKKILNTVNRIVTSVGKAAAEKESESESKEDGVEKKAEKEGAEEEMVKGPIENVYFASFIMQ